MIPKFPNVPELTRVELEHITHIVFGEEEPLPERVDGIFIFGGTHPGLWETGADLYHRGIAKKIYVSGGIKPNRQMKRHPDWVGEGSEGAGIVRQLEKLGVPFESIVLEERASNSLENVVFMMPYFKADKIKSLVLVGKNYGRGRQVRTFRKICPDIDAVFCGFDTHIAETDALLRRCDWMYDEVLQSHIFGEYLRNVFYSRRGDILNDFVVPAGLVVKIERILNVEV